MNYVTLPNELTYYKCNRFLKEMRTMAFPERAAAPTEEDASDYFLRFVNGCRDMAEYLKDLQGVSEQEWLNFDQ
jgi:hypothetical protein